MILVFKPMAAMAKTIKNLLSSLSGVKNSMGTWKKEVITVVMTEARMKKDVYKRQAAYFMGYAT